ncbi:hypothetical protein AUI06_06420 [archaeon 13_2_20CM_2_52_21]|nr:MAG: hypothetical protein AUI06_06420 [archaeon 13_2_20CM_2_52_21]
MPSLTSREAVAVQEKPLAEVLVEGELSPFEDEALYRILRRTFRVEHPSYAELSDEDLATRVNVTFHYPYVTAIFTNVLRENWRELKELLRQVRYRRGRAGAAVTFTFVGEKNRLVFRSGVLEEKELSSALDQIGHLTGILGQMLRPETMEKPLELVEAKYDMRSDRWHEFKGFGSSDPTESYVFDESSFRWVRS